METCDRCGPGVEATHAVLTSPPLTFCGHHARSLRHSPKLAAYRWLHAATGTELAVTLAAALSLTEIVPDLTAELVR